MLSTKLSSSTAAAVAAGWDVSKATFNGTPKNWLELKAQTIASSGLFFKTDGTKLYAVNQLDNYVLEYDLSTAWDITTANYLQDFYIGNEDTSAAGLFFKPDGTKMYIMGNQGDDVNEYDLSSAWDITTASYLQNFSVAAQDTNPTDVFFKSDGTKMYMLGNISDDVYEYDLSSAWDISTASYLQNFAMVGISVPTGFFFKSDGTKMYVVDSSVNDVNEFDLSSAWNISTASYLRNFSMGNRNDTPQDLFFKSDGTEMYILRSNPANIYRYDLSSAWDISTASFTYPSTEYFYVGTQESSPFDLFFKPDGTKMYIVGTVGDAVYEYDLSSAWDISTLSYLQSFSIVSQDSVTEDLFFKPDGTKMYTVGAIGDAVYEYDLSSAWDISTLSYLQSFSISAQETAPTSLFFKPDGTKMYVLGDNGNDVNEYDLSTAWDISTASYLQNFSIVSQDANPEGLFFKPDGTKMYVIGISSDAVNEYDLSTPWDISTASYLQLFFVRSEDSFPAGVSFKDDGTKMYIIGGASDAVWSYDL